jgi:hypothetical protein
MRHAVMAGISTIRVAMLISLAINASSVTAGQDATNPAAALSPRVEIVFAYQRQQGKASNQFAVWIEDASGKFIKTLYATRFTASGGWKRRPQSLPVWVNASQLIKRDSNEVDAITGATPLGGKLAYVWDCKNDEGLAVPPGEYRYLVEANLRWTSMVLYRGTIRIGESTQHSLATSGFSGGNAQEREMITQVAATYYP